jgi:tyrosinase
MEIYTSPPLDVVPTGAAPLATGIPVFDRADLIFYDVDHSGPSFTARVFLANPAANASTPTTAEAGYAGCFTIFGHGGCVGTDDDHCNPKARTEDEFDLRMPHPLLPQTKVVTVTDALRRLGPVSQVTVTVVPVVPGESAPEVTDALEFTTVRLTTYRHDSRLEDDVEEDEASTI